MATQIMTLADWRMGYALAPCMPELTCECRCWPSQLPFHPWEISAEHVGILWLLCSYHVLTKPSLTWRRGHMWKRKEKRRETEAEADIRDTPRWGIYITPPSSHPRQDVSFPKRYWGLTTIRWCLESWIFGIVACLITTDNQKWESISPYF